MSCGLVFILWCFGGNMHAAGHCASLFSFVGQLGGYCCAVSHPARVLLQLDGRCGMRVGWSKGWVLDWPGASVRPPHSGQKPCCPTGHSPLTTEQSLTALPHVFLFLPGPWLLPQQQLGMLEHFYLCVVCRWMSLWPHWCCGHLRPQQAVLSKQGAAQMILGWALMNKLSTFLSHLGFSCSAALM